MIRIANPKHAVCALILPLVLSACEMSPRPPLSSAHAQPANTITWAEVAPDAVADGNVEMYY